MSLRLFVLFAAVPLAACGQPADGAGGTAPAADSSAPAAPTATPTLPASQRAMLVADGIVYRSGDGTPDKKLTFGESEQDATGKLVTITSESTEYFEPDASGCSTTTFGGAAGYFKGGKFIGFGTSSDTLKTDKGIGVGSTRAEVTAAYAPEFEVASDGFTTFMSSGFFGSLEGQGEGAKVSGISIGDACE